MVSSAWRSRADCGSGSLRSCCSINVLHCKLLTTDCVGKCIIFLVPITSSQYAGQTSAKRKKLHASQGREGRGDVDGGD